jgi:Ni2+-binding GTPase involved in maturation of urease and hydrogenase
MLPRVEYTRRDLTQAVLDAPAGLNTMLRATVRSNAAIINPMSNLVEAAEAHLGIVEELLGLMNPAAETVSSDDLQVIGVDDTPTNRFDHERDF